MIDKVQPNVPVSYTNNIGHVEGKRETLTKKSRQVDGSPAEVSLPGDAVALQKIMQSVKEAPDIREDIVQVIQSQLEAGTYQINAEALAERLLPFFK